MPENQLVELFDHGLAQAAEAHLHDAYVVLHSLAGDGAGKIYRLRQRLIDVYRQ
ncbi:MAG: hypothetical protein QOF32_2203 [Gammaproteobacteria bacterium]|nr:hypothetical protein [Gammaproteobacteria bacterium]